MTEIVHCVGIMRPHDTFSLTSSMQLQFVLPVVNSFGQSAPKTESQIVQYGSNSPQDKKNENWSIQEPAVVEQDAKFVAAGACAFADCGVTLVCDDGSRLYACKVTLSIISQLFQSLFNGESKEKYAKQFRIAGVSYPDLLLFLQCAAEENPADCRSIPYCCRSVCSLIALADDFVCQSLKRRIAQHLLTAEIFSTPASVKQCIIYTACERKAGCSQILEATVRLCASMEMHEIAELSLNLDKRIMSAIYALKVATQPAASPPAVCLCSAKEWKVHIPEAPEPAVWYCNQCGEPHTVQSFLDRISTFPLEMKLLS